MSTALIIALMAVGISLLTVFIALNAAKAQKSDGGSGDSGACGGDGGSSDCGSDGGGGGGCD